jgi:hypothetical protein
MNHAHRSPEKISHPKHVIQPNQTAKSFTGTHIQPEREGKKVIY